VSWRTIFFINVPVGVGALIVLTKTPPSPARPAQLDWIGQLTAVVAMGGLVFGVIEAGAWGITALPVIGALLLALIGAVCFIAAERRTAHPMVPLALTRRPIVRVASIIGFAFMVSYYGLPFMFSLYFQQLSGLSALATGVLFLPMFLVGFILTPFSARIAQRLGAPTLITTGLILMVVGMVALACVTTADMPDWVLSSLMILIGLGGPLVMPMTTALLLEHVPTIYAGTASGLFNTSRQVGGALAIAVFGALLAHPGTFIEGLRTSLLIASVLALLAAGASLRLRPSHLKEQSA
jgi:predicted MFS family arabinose efflux permease